ncbi:DUF2637 domain-containing protein [Streptomyces sp. NPDC051567]|uniref:DUF2637 domain-containing protein n=1 Tax=Streptomyces sp. NPDC051567 TaxID=3365660 RepID=UPI0037B33EEE
MTGWQKTAVVGIVIAALGLGGLGLYLSFGSVARFAFERLHFGSLTRGRLFAVGVDVGIMVLIGIDLVMAWLRRPIAWIRIPVWLLTGATVVLNAASVTPAPGRAWEFIDYLAVAAHGLVPVLFISVVEVGRDAVDRIVRPVRPGRDAIPLIRWALDWRATWAIYCRMRLWRIDSYPEMIRRDQELLGYEQWLARKYKGDLSKATADERLPMTMAPHGYTVDRALLLPAVQEQAAREREEADKRHKRAVESATKLAGYDAQRKELLAQGEVDKTAATVDGQTGIARAEAEGAVLLAQRVAEIERQAHDRAQTAQDRARQASAEREEADEREKKAGADLRAADLERRAAEKRKEAAQADKVAAAETMAVETETITKARQAAAEASRRAAEEEKAAAEARRTAAESDRRAAEETLRTRQAATATAEAAKTEAEADRRAAEARRATAEADQAEAEIRRAAAEADRLTTEENTRKKRAAVDGTISAQTAAEAAKAAAEIEQSAAETRRAAAEADRRTTEETLRAQRAATETALAAQAAAEAQQAAAEARRAAAEIEAHAIEMEDAAKLKPRDRAIRRVARMILAAGGDAARVPLADIQSELDVSPGTASDYQSAAKALIASDDYEAVAQPA